MSRMTDPVDSLLYFQYKKDRLESKVQIYSSEQQRKEADKSKSGRKKKIEDEQVILNESGLPEFIEVNVGGKKTFKRVKDILSKFKKRRKKR